MARRRRKISVGDLSGGLALGLVLALVLGTLAAVTWRAEPGAGLGPADIAKLGVAVVGFFDGAALTGPDTPTT